jgi:hypothetical protein
VAAVTAEVQRNHWWEVVMDAGWAIQVPKPTVSSSPTLRVPETVGKTVFNGALLITSVVAD